LPYGNAFGVISMQSNGFHHKWHEAAMDCTFSGGVTNAIELLKQ
jgi:hypothetical protein